MITLNLKPVFKARGIERPFSFLTGCGFPTYTAHNLLNNRTGSINFKHLEKLCMLLNCTPNDLLLWTPEKNSSFSNTHPLAKLYKPNVDYNLKDVLKNISLEDVQKLVNTIKDGNNRESS